MERLSPPGDIILSALLSAVWTPMARVPVARVLQVVKQASTGVNERWRCVCALVSVISTVWSGLKEKSFPLM